jgi:hypothetical protein
MLGGSLMIVWYDTDTGLPNNGVYGHSNGGATVNGIDVEIDDLTAPAPPPVQFQLKRKQNQALGLAVEMGGAPPAELTASTNTQGKNLVFQTASGGDLHGYTHRAKTVLEFPSFDKKLSKLTLTNVALDSGTVGSPCTLTGTTLDCPINIAHTVRTVVTLHVCKGVTCKAPAP